MRITQIVLPDASAFERKNQRVDQAAFMAAGDVVVAANISEPVSGDVAHIYTSRSLSPRSTASVAIPFVSSAGVERRRWSFHASRAPRFVISPLGEGDARVPEAVEDFYFEQRWEPKPDGQVRTVGSFARADVRNLVQQTMRRIARFRSDVEWQLFERTPLPEDFASLDLWADPAISDHDYDGFVAEAGVTGIPVVAARTPINSLRLEKGRTGVLVPVNDPNEWAHAILTALFKPEQGERFAAAARQTASKFRSSQRMRALRRLYEQMTS